MKKKIFLALLTYFLLMLLPLLALSQGLEGLWFNEEKSAKIEIYQGKDDKYYGKIVWLKDPYTDGKPKTDINNPKVENQKRAINGLVLLKSFKKISENKYEDGTIYDPKNGKTYSCHLTLAGNKLNVRGYIGFSALGRTTIWTRAK